MACIETAQEQNDMSDKGAHRKIKLTKIDDDGKSNNYGEFEVKSKSKLDAAGLWEYIGGEKAVAPHIPILREDTQITGNNSITGEEVTVVVPGNKVDIEEAKKRAGPWNQTNKHILSLIINAVPTPKLYLIQDCKTVKEAWDALKQEYHPSNMIQATLMKTKISSYIFQHGMSAKKWMNDMCTMYNELCDLNPDGMMMLDDAFVRQIIELMPRDDDWRTLSGS
jgi:arsenate reductase-like glutaredoxin family protein